MRTINISIYELTRIKNCTDLEWTWQKHGGAHCSQLQSEQKLSWQQPKWRRRKRTQKPKTPSFANLLYLSHSPLSHCSHSKQTEPNFQDPGSDQKNKERLKLSQSDHSSYSFWWWSKNETSDFIGKRLVRAKTIKIERLCECERVTWWGQWRWLRRRNEKGGCDLFLIKYDLFIFCLS